MSAYVPVPVAPILSPVTNALSDTVDVPSSTIVPLIVCAPIDRSCVVAGTVNVNSALLLSVTAADVAVIAPSTEPVTLSVAPFVTSTLSFHTTTTVPVSPWS